MPPINGEATHDITTLRTTLQIDEVLPELHLENEANADDAANDGVGGRDGQTHARRNRQPDRSSHHGSHETEGKGLRQIVELLRIGHLEFEIDRQDAFRTVSVTASPAKNAPANSNTAAMMTACFRVSAREPTLVPMAFATSFAPMFQAM